jgi:hypothetical protein
VKAKYPWCAGGHCCYRRLNERWGIKRYTLESMRDHTFRISNLAGDLAPCCRLKFAWRQWHCYVTEHCEPAGQIEREELMELIAGLERRFREVSDVIPQNLGRIDGRLVLLDVSAVE